MPLITSIESLGLEIYADCLVEVYIGIYVMNVYQLHNIHKSQRNIFPYFPALSLSGC